MKLAILLALLANPTYKDVKPVLKNRCSKCHDTMQDRNWQVYKDAFAYRYSIKNKIILRDMPRGEKMPKEERDLVVRWVDQGAKE